MIFLRLKWAHITSKLLACCLLLATLSNTQANQMAPDNIELLVIKPIAPPHSQISAQRWQQLSQAFAKRRGLFVDGLLPGLEKTSGPEAGAVYVNELILERSPYLLRHATNPINWTTWSPDIFARAKAENKLIFLSIGYSSCHWCHVMEQDSFVKEDIANLLNQHFIAVKVDRELHPEVDALYTRALDLVTGSSGWPITALLDAKAAPVFIDAFLAHDSLVVLLTRLSELWQQQPSHLTQNAARVMALLAQQQAPEQGIKWQKNTLDITVLKLQQQLDPVNGGFSGAPKFPTEGMMLFLLDHLTRSNDQTTADLVKLQLDQMIAKGLLDSVNGGFHRYATDKSWLLPHFEKMLYNQGQLLLVYSRAYKIFGEARYLTVIKDTINFMRRWLYKSSRGYYSAIDAQHLGVGGQYYSWSAAQLQTIAPQQAKAAGLTTFALHQGESLGVYFTKPASTAAIAIAASLRQFKKGQGRPFIDKKIITAWNALAVWGLTEAYQVSKAPEVKALALDIAQSLWSRHFVSQNNQLIRASYITPVGGIEDKQTGVSGTLDDYAYFAKAMLAVFDMSGDKRWLNRAKLLTKQALDQFLSGDQGFFFTGKSQRAALPLRLKQSQDGELLAAGPVMTQVLHDLGQRSGDRDLIKQAKRSVDYLKTQFNQAPLAHLYAGLVINTLDNKSRDNLQYFAAGRGQVSLSRSSLNEPGTTNNACAAASWTLKISLQPGWHINSATPRQAYLRPTRVTFTPEKAYRVNYPVGKLVTLGFQQAQLSVYEGEFELALFPIKKPSHRPNQGADTGLSIALQACSDNVCLMPQTLMFYLPNCAIKGAEIR